MERDNTNIDRLLDLYVNPEEHGPEETAEIMADDEARGLYEAICAAEEAMRDEECSPDIDAEWERFAATQLDKPKRRFAWLGSRAAIVTAIALTSMAALAIGLTATMSNLHSQPGTEADLSTAIPEQVIDKGDDGVASDSTATEPEKVLFEDASLETIMSAIAVNYGIEVRFNDEKNRHMHMYYRLDTSLSLEEVLEQLNTFGEINIRRDGNLLILD